MMNYTPEQCQSMFTKEQVGLMTAMLQGPRSGLLDALLGTPQIVNEELEFFPNPVDDILTIRFSGTTRVSSISIFDLQGRLVVQGKETEMNVSQLFGRYVFDSIRYRGQNLPIQICKKLIPIRKYVREGC
ncbi:MAG: T9SS type A sorting domain-containing protein [Saprospiraceae bacterium]